MRSGSGHPPWCSPLLETWIPPLRLELAGQELEDWSAPTAEHVPVPAPPAARCRRVARVEMPGKAQADIAYGFNTIRRLDPRYYAYWMMNNVLGQFGLGGRLADNIRERQGMAYYVYSTFDPSVGEGPLLVRAGVDPVNVSRTIDAIDEEVRRAGREGPHRPRSRRRASTWSDRFRACSRPTMALPPSCRPSSYTASALDYDQRLPVAVRLHRRGPGCGSRGPNRCAVARRAASPGIHSSRA